MKCHHSNNDRSFVLSVLNIASRNEFVRVIFSKLRTFLLSVKVNIRKNDRVKHDGGLCVDFVLKGSLICQNQTE